MLCSVIDRSYTKRDEGRRRLRRQYLDTTVSRMNALLQRFEIQTGFGSDDDLAVQHTSIRKFKPGCFDKVGEVARHQPFIPASQLDVIAISKTYASEAIPLWFI